MTDYNKEKFLQRTFVFAERRELAKDTYELVFEKPEGFSYVPGQSMKFLFKEPYEEKQNRRSFSFVSAPYEEVLRFAFRDTGTWRKGILMGLKEGDTIEMLGPRGDFAYPEENGDALLIAGGIGVTPFVSMLSHAAHIGDPRRFMLVCIDRTLDLVTYHDELMALARANANVTVRHFLTRESADGFEAGRPDAEVLAPYMTDCQKIYIAGAPAMVDEVSALLTSLGISESALSQRWFDGYEEHVVAAA